MKKNFITIVLSLLFATAMADNQQTATFDPTVNMESFIREIVREEISAVTSPVPQALTNGILIADRERIYQGGRQLSVVEVRYLMIKNAEAEALGLFNRGVQRNRNGNIWLWTGVGVVGAGFITGLSGNWWDYWVLVGPMTISGVTAVATGLILRKSGRRQIQNSVDTFNRNTQTSHIELNFGVTPNGVGMAVNF